MPIYRYAATTNKKSEKMKICIKPGKKSFLIWSEKDTTGLQQKKHVWKRLKSVWNIFNSAAVWDRKTCNKSTCDICNAEEVLSHIRHNQTEYERYDNMTSQITLVSFSPLYKHKVISQSGDNCKYKKEKNGGRGEKEETKRNRWTGKEWIEIK